MRRWYGAGVLLLLCMASLLPVAAQPATDTIARAYLGDQQQIGPGAAAVDPARGLIYQAFLGSGTLQVLNSADLRILRRWPLPTLAPVSATPQLVLSPSGERIGLLLAAQGRASLAIWDASGTSLGMTSLPYDNRPISLYMTDRRAFVLRQGLPPLAVDAAAVDIAGAPPAGASSGIVGGGTLAYISVGAADRVGLTLLNTENLALRTTTFDAPATASFSFAAAGSRLFVGSCGGVAQIDLDSGAVVRSLDTETVGCLTDVVVSPDGLRLLAMTFSPSGSTSIVEVDVPTWQVTRRFDVEGSFGRLTPAWSQGKVFVGTRDYVLLDDVFTGVLDMATGVLTRLPYAVTLSDGLRGFNVDGVALRQYSPATDTWRVATYGGAVEQIARAANGSVYARIGGVVARIPAGATAPDAFFPGGDGMLLVADRLYSHDREHLFVSDVGANTTRLLARLPLVRAQPGIAFAPGLNRLVLSWVRTPRNVPAQAGLAIVDAATGAVDLSFFKTSERITIALDPETHRLYVATAEPRPDGTTPAAGELSVLALDTGNQTQLTVPGIGLGNAQPPVLAFDVERGLLGISDGTSLAAYNRAGAQVWRVPVPATALDVTGATWLAAGQGGLAQIDPQTGRQIARENVGYTLTVLDQAGPVAYGVDGRSGAIVSAQASGGALLFRIEGLVFPVTSLYAVAGTAVFGDSGGLVTTTIPDVGSANRGNRSTFARVWQRADEPVASGAATRSWTWGPVPWAARAEPYRESPGGLRLVEYRDKTRMEVTLPGADSSSPYYVTNGLLVTEMLRGQIQVGNQEFVPHPCPDDRERFLCPRDTRIAGDLANNEAAPTYTDMRVLAATTPRAVGQRSGATFTRDPASGTFVVGNQADLATDATTLVEYDAVTGHNIARVFWQYMNQRGPVVENERLVDALVVEPLFAFGRPITEPYWVRARIGGRSAEQFVLVQLFERRVLTYTPGNPDPFKVEMGNVGQHYYLWRYGMTRW